MTEYWVSQGNKWCDFCKIYISNNPLSIRTHELGQRHKDNVAKKLATMRKESAAKEKEQKEAARALKEIEAKAKRSYQRDLASLERVDASRLEPNKKNADEGPCSSATRNEDRIAHLSKGGSAPCLVISTPLNPTTAVKGRPSSIAINKRKRDDGKTKTISKEETEALKAREAARKRMEEREKQFMGHAKALYCNGTGFSRGKLERKKEGDFCKEKFVGDFSDECCTLESKLVVGFCFLFVIGLKGKQRRVFVPL